MDTKKLYIIPECYIDTNLIEYLFQSSGVNHQKGCNVVAKKMIEVFNNQFSIGIVDNDKKQHSYIEKECEIIAKSEHITLVKHCLKPHYFIMIAPAMEVFILNCAKEAGVNMQDFGLPSDLESLKQATKNVTGKNDLRFKKLFKALQCSQEMKVLSAILRYLDKYKYQSNAEELCKLFCKGETICNY